MAETKLSAKEAATELGTDARTLRKFLRDITEKDDQPGQGGRWSISKRRLNKLREEFDTWQSTKTRRAEAAEDEALDDLDEELIDDDEIEDEDDLDEVDATDEDLEEIEDEDVEEDDEDDVEEIA